MTDNVDVFKKIIFRIPELRKIIGGIIGLGAIYSALLFLSFQAFTDLPLRYPGMFAFFLLFTIPTLVSSELLTRFLPDYPRRWGYFLGLSNQLIIFIYSLILTGADNFVNAWNIFWIGIFTVYLSNFFILLLSLGYRHMKKISLLSLSQPLFLLAAFHFSVGWMLEIPFYLYIFNLGLLVIALAVLLISFGVFEYLVGANVPNISITELTSGLLQKKDVSLELGYPSRPDVQTLEIDNENSQARIAIPWIHPGPLEGFGGGRITSHIIDSLNRNGDGFFFHVPSTHLSDPAKPEDREKILDAMEEPEKTGKASRLVSKDYNGLKFYGRRLDGKNIVYMQARDYGKYDDYEVSVFRDVIDPEKTVLVDLHNHRKTMSPEDRAEVWDGTVEAERMREKLKDFLDFMEDQELHDYHSGFSSKMDETRRFALVEEVDGQETIIFGMEGNEMGDELEQLENKYSKVYDEALVFTTDTHRSIHELSSSKQVPVDDMEEVIKEASETVSDASIGLCSRKSGEMNLLKEDYSGLVFSINILVRLIPLTLILFYIALVIWVF
ncbi:MAG: DUF2070 family protein [Candidatus Nanohaloarchaea archaeon]